ncbi:hypothetical protein CC80DRAFT_508168 [Byssothecium circinans]|uniref:Uncharacterized protein n=1 Tax=Byssothecium circinans TaxID=147558 RepID=A0A6A5TIY0_9PLEO|nr:hypothetical protein CC80DRAFT_508168 [Byssothecium circinans]
MAARFAPPPRTPSPKIRIHRSQSFDSPSSRISVTPIDDSPYSKSTGSIAKPLPRYNALQAAEQAMVIGRNKVMLHTNLSDDSLISDSSSAASSPTDGSENGSQFGLFTSGSPVPPSPSPSPQVESMRKGSAARSSRPSSINTRPATLPSPPEILSSSLAIYQDTSVPMHDPWLVRMVLDLYDTRGFDWTVIADMVERMWGFRAGAGVGVVVASVVRWLVFGFPLSPSCSFLPRSSSFLSGLRSLARTFLSRPYRCCISSPLALSSQIKSRPGAKAAAALHPAGYTWQAMNGRDSAMVNNHPNGVR